ncbi:MAG: hypothetical protein HFH05_11455 [Lachnospiraceae bacterium]|nr:hypothetical protein [Lachnospiraceae bacterium]
MPLVSQGYVTDEELEQILNVIDTSNGIGKRYKAIIHSAAAAGLRTCDLIRMKLADIDRRKGRSGLYRKGPDGLLLTIAVDGVDCRQRQNG